MSRQSLLDTPIEYLKGVGPKRAEALKTELQIFNYADLLSFYPFRYEDRTKFYKIKDMQPNMAYVQLVGKITSLNEVGAKRGKRLVATFQDESGSVELVWFKGTKWIKSSLKLNTDYVLFGKPSLYGTKLNISHPELELLSDSNPTMRSAMQAVYSSTEKLNNQGLHSRGIGKLVNTLLEQVKGTLTDTLPSYFLEQHHLVRREEAVFNIHKPQSQDKLKQALYRLKFEELFYIQLGLLKQKNIIKGRFRSFTFEKIADTFNTFYDKNLPFELTDAQKRVLKEIRTDVGTGMHMNRLLQGDVGSGKTIVALMTMLMAIDNGYQTLLMAPTEILANQHYTGITELAEGLGLKIVLLTGSVTAANRKPIHEGLQSGEIDIIIGTHALLEDAVQFKNLGIAIVDEQHRFGVAQRAKLWKKNSLPPHVLVMTATPIPRTLAMALYGDLDISVIDELPPGRKAIKTVHRYDSNRLKVFKFMKDEIAKGRQIYVVYPLIQESEKMDYKDLMDGYESIVREFPIPDYQVSIVHGKMKAADKDYEMNRFVKGETQIMVATTVIEVGVNVPNASVMVIESAERFGLSQLHQLRGRVGRGAEQSFCILLTSHKLSNEAKIRLETMVKTNDGFEIADVDLKLRGPGDMMGTRQSGLLDLKIADLAKDSQILQYVRGVAQKIMEYDPNFQAPENKILLEQYKLQTKGKINWSRIS